MAQLFSLGGSGIEMKSKLPFIVFGFAIAVALGASAVALVYARFIVNVVYDFNYETLHNTLSQEQRDGMIGNVRANTGHIVMLLIVTNILWLVVGLFLLSRIRRRLQQPPNTALEPTATSP